MQIGRRGEVSEEAGRTAGRLTARALERDRKDVLRDDRDRLLRATRKEELAVEADALDLLEGDVRAVVREVKGQVRPFGERVATLLVGFGAGGLQDGFDLLARHGAQV